MYENAWLPTPSQIPVKSNFLTLSTLKQVYFIII